MFANYDWAGKIDVTATIGVMNDWHELHCTGIGNAMVARQRQGKTKANLDNRSPFKM
jgi:hypothetical protein